MEKKKDSTIEGKRSSADRGDLLGDGAGISADKKKRAATANTKRKRTHTKRYEEMLEDEQDRKRRRVDDDADDSSYTDDAASLAPELPHLTLQTTNGGSKHDEPRSLYSRLIVFTVNNDWPHRTDELCRYDLHPFDTVPIGVPTSFNVSEGRYALQGYFCSYECARASIEMDSSLNSVTRRERLELFDSFAHSVLNVPKRQVHECIGSRPPLALLCQRYAQLLKHLRQQCQCDELSDEAKHRTLRAAVQWWRSQLNPYEQLRVVPSMFVRSAEVYEQSQQRQRVQIRQQDRAELIMHQRPTPLILSERGQMEQENWVRSRVQQQQASGGGGGESAAAVAPPRRQNVGPLSFMLGLQPVPTAMAVRKKRS